MRPAALALTAASYGSLIAIFESLTGGIPFALAMLPLLLALGFEGDRRDYLTQAVSALGHLLRRGRDLLRAQEDPGDRVSRRSGVVLLAPRSIGCSARRCPSPARRSRSAICFRAIAAGARLIGFGSPNLGTVLVLGSLAVLAVETWRTRSTPSHDPACLLARRRGPARLGHGLPQPHRRAPLFHGAAAGHSGDRRDGSGRLPVCPHAKRVAIAARMTYLTCDDHLACTRRDAHARLSRPRRTG